MKLSVVFTVAGKYDRLREALRSVPAALDGLEAEVIVVDSGFIGDPTPCSEGSGRETDRAFPQAELDAVGATYIHNEQRPPNIHEGWNAAQIARGDVIGVFNDDVIFDFRCLYHCYDAIARGLVRACYPTCFNKEHERDLFNRRVGCGDPRQPATVVGPPEFRGFAFLLHRSVYEEVGPFDEQFYFGQGDFDYARRLQEARIDARQVHNAAMFHYLSATVSWYGGPYWGALRRADQICSTYKWQQGPRAPAPEDDFPLNAVDDLRRWLVQVHGSDHVIVDNTLARFDHLALGDALLMHDASWEALRHWRQQRTDCLIATVGFVDGFATVLRPGPPGCCADLPPDSSSPRYVNLRRRPEILKASYAPRKTR